MIPYGRQFIDANDIRAVVDVLQSDNLTQGPAVTLFEEAFASRICTRFAIAVNSGTAALHACMAALGIGPGDEVVVPPMTFTATANCAVFVGATPVFADVTASGHIDPGAVERKITGKTKAVIAVDYAGWPCDYAALSSLCRQAGIPLICDACHALGATWKGRSVGSIGLLNCFSFHPVKHVATGEGGMVTTDDEELAQKIRDFRTHGITKDATRFGGLVSAGAEGVFSAGLTERGPWYYEMMSLGYNYRMPDINAALGRSQLMKLDQFVTRRRDVARMYGEMLTGDSRITLPVSDLGHQQAASPACPCEATHSFHLFPVRINFKGLGKTRTHVMKILAGLGVGTQVHYIPVHLQPFYRKRFGTAAGDCPVAEDIYQSLLSLPVFPAMTDEDVEHVVHCLKERVL